MTIPNISRERYGTQNHPPREIESLFVCLSVCLCRAVPKFRNMKHTTSVDPRSFHVLFECHLHPPLLLFLVPQPHHNISFLISSMVSSSSSSSAMTTNNHIAPPHNLVAQSWTSAAGGYNELFVPRFQPWTSQCLQLLREEFLRSSSLSSSSLSLLKEDDEHKDDTGTAAVAFVPCCGPGQELVPVSDIVAPMPVLGMDIAPGMVQVAQTRIENYDSASRRSSSCSSTTPPNQNRKDSPGPQHHHPNIQVMVGDCSGSSSGNTPIPTIPRIPSPPPYGVVFSIFGLQQMIDPLATLQYWISNLRIGGIAVICFWPPGGKVETDPQALWGPTLRQLLQQHAAAATATEQPQQQPQQQNTTTTSTTTTTTTTHYWDEDIVKVAEEAGADIVHDFEQSHEITWQSPHQFWNAMTQSGPWHKLRLTLGDEYVDGALKQDFHSILFADSSSPTTTLSHSPCARILVLRKKKDPMYVVSES